MSTTIYIYIYIYIVGSGSWYTGSITDFPIVNPCTVFDKPFCNPCKRGFPWLVYIRKNSKEVMTHNIIIMILMKNGSKEEMDGTRYL